MRNKSTKVIITLIFAIMFIGFGHVKAATYNGWELNSNQWNFYIEGNKALGWISYKGNWFHLNEDGNMTTGWLEENNCKYYLNSSGEMKTGWLTLGNKSYYFGRNGILLTNTITPDGYAVGSDGVWDGNGQSMIIERIKGLENSSQAVVVTSKDYNTSVVEIQSFEKVNGNWVRAFEKMAGVIGYNGFAINKIEGDGKSPVGVFTFGTAFGKEQNPGTIINYRQINYNDYWIDDPYSPYYNTWQVGPPMGRWKATEGLLRSDWLYDYGIVINYNSERIPFKGSGIFFHLWRQEGKGTAGCTATTRENMLKIIMWLNPDKNPVIIQGPEDVITGL